MIRTADDEARNAKYAHIERERRWLVDRRQRPELAANGSILIDDRYIDGTRLRLRRMTDRASGTTSCKLTKKYEADDATARPIVTAYLTPAEYELLAKLPARPLAKWRHSIEWGGNCFSLDIFEGELAPLELLEIECADASALGAIEAPPWVTREISYETIFQGGALAVSGIAEKI